jgi:hypothetical protein
MSSIVQASTIDRYIIVKPALHLIRGWQTAHDELDLPVGKLPPALDDFLVPLLRNISDNCAGFVPRCLQRQRECFKDNVIIFDLATVVPQVEPIRNMLRSINDIPNRLRRNCLRAPRPA